MARVLINLHSKQTIPNYVAIKEIKPDKVIAFVTNKYSEQISVFEKITKVDHVLKTIDAYQLENNFNVIQEVIDELDSKCEIVVNYTGGTKVMAVSLVLKVLTSVKQSLLLVYVNTFDNKLEFLKINSKKEIGAFNEDINEQVFLETYVQLKEEKIKSVEDKPSHENLERFDLSESLLLDNKLVGIFRKQKTFFEKIKRVNRPKQFHNMESENYELAWNKNQIILRTNELEYKYMHIDGGVYFTGGWLEEYVFIKLFNTGFYTEVLSSVKFDFTSFSLDDKPNRDKIFKNEIDVVVSRGLKTVFIECKAGYVSQDYVYKLQVIRDHFLGTFGEAVLVTKFPQKENIVEKCNDANIKIVSGENIKNIDSVINQLII